MYPRGELNYLAARKATLLGRIAYHRTQCRTGSAGLARPLHWLDHGLAWWRRLAPVFKVAGVPLALLVKRKLFPRTAFLGTLLRFAPAAFAAFKRFSTPT